MSFGGGYTNWISLVSVGDDTNQQQKTEPEMILEVTLAKPTAMLGPNHWQPEQRCSWIWSLNQQPGIFEEMVASNRFLLGTGSDGEDLLGSSPDCQPATHQKINPPASRSTAPTKTDHDQLQRRIHRVFQMFTCGGVPNGVETV